MSGDCVVCVATIFVQKPAVGEELLYNIVVQALYSIEA